MRFALIATTLTAIVAVPWAVAATGPRMSPEAFVSAVRCVAVQQVAHPELKFAASEFALNAEARAQAPETVETARRVVRAVYEGEGGVANSEERASMGDCGLAL